MDRLTKWNGGDFSLKHESCPKHGQCNGSVDCVAVLIERLAEYEEIGLSPESIWGLCEMEKRSRMAQMLRWEEANAEGRLLVLPCKPGTTVFRILNNTNACRECDAFSDFYGCDPICDRHPEESYPQYAETPLCEKQFWDIVIFTPPQDWIYQYKDQFGKTVFLTKEEAEAQLAVLCRNGE